MSARFHKRTAGGPNSDWLMCICFPCSAKHSQVEFPIAGYTEVVLSGCQTRQTFFFGCVFPRCVKSKGCSNYKVPFLVMFLAIQAEQAECKVENAHRTGRVGGPILEEALLLDGIEAEGVAAYCSFTGNLAAKNAHRDQRPKATLRMLCFKVQRTPHGSHTSILVSYHNSLMVVPLRLCMRSFCQSKCLYNLAVVLATRTERLREMPRGF